MYVWELRDISNWKDKPHINCATTPWKVGKPTNARRKAVTWILGGPKETPDCSNWEMQAFMRWVGW